MTGKGSGRDCLFHQHNGIHTANGGTVSSSYLANPLRVAMKT